MSVASTVLGFAVLTAAPVALAGTDSTASRDTLARDPAVRWQFDTGG